MSESFSTERSLPSPFWWMVLLPLGHIKKLGPGRVFTLLGLWPSETREKDKGPRGLIGGKPKNGPFCGFVSMFTKETADSTGHVVSF